MAEQTPLFGASVNEVNVNVEGATRESIRARDIGTSKGDAIDFGKLLGQAAQVTTQISNAEKIAEANTAKQDYYNIVSSEGYRDGDATVRAGMLEEMNGTLHERSKAYQDAYIGYSSSEYNREYDKRGEIEDNAFYNSAPAAFKVHEMETGEGPDQFIEAMVTENPRLDRNVLKTSLLTGVYEEVFAEVSSATNEKELSDALMNVEDIKASYKTDKFLTTKSKKGKELITAAERQVNNLVNAKKAEFKLGHQQNISNAVDSEYSIHPSQLEEDFNGAYPNPITREKEKKAYEAKYQETSEAHAFNSQYTLGDNPGTYPNDAAKKQRQFAVTDGLTQMFADGSASEFVRIAHNEKGLTKETGDMIIAQLNKSTDATELASIFGMINKVNAYPKGPSVLRQMFTDDEYTRIMKTQYVSMYRPDYTPQQARDYVDGTSRNIARAEMSISKKKDMQEYAVGLGKQGQKFLGVMKTLTDTDPQMAEDLMKDVAKFFDGQKGETTTGKPTDVSMGHLPDTLDPERTDKMIDDALPNTSSLTYIDNMIVGYDDIGGVVKIINSDSILERSNRNYEDEMVREQQATQEGIKTSPITGAKVAAKSLGRTMVDNMGKAITGFYPTLSELGSNIAGAVGENIMRNLKEDIKNSPEFVQDAAGFVNKFLDIEIDNPAQAEDLFDAAFEEAYLESMKDESSKLDTKMPEVQNNTLTSDVQASLAYALMNNKVQKEIIDTKIAEIETTPITEEEEPMIKEVVAAAVITTSGVADLSPDQNKSRLLKSVGIAEAGFTENPKDTGNWYKGKLIGTNHGISAPVLAEYLGRTPTKQEMKNLTKKKADEIIWKNYGEKYGIDSLPRELQEIVLHGVVNSEGHAVKIMQKLLGVAADGSVGPMTKRAMAKARFTKKEFKDALLAKYKTFSSWKDFGKGWTNRFERLAK